MNKCLGVFLNKWILVSFVLIILNFNLSAVGYSDGSWDYKLPDEIGNLFKTKEKTDRQYGKAGQLLKDETYSYTYDEERNKVWSRELNIYSETRNETAFLSFEIDLEKLETLANVTRSVHEGINVLKTLDKRDKLKPNAYYK